jgi:hypothetical protein
MNVCFLGQRVVTNTSAVAAPCTSCFLWYILRVLLVHGSGLEVHAFVYAAAICHPFIP